MHTRPVNEPSGACTVHAVRAICRAVVLVRTFSFGGWGSLGGDRRRMAGVILVPRYGRLIQPGCTTGQRDERVADACARRRKAGEPAYDPTVKTALGLNGDDEIMGFLYLGTNSLYVPLRQGTPHSLGFRGGSCTGGVSLGRFRGLPLRLCGMGGHQNGSGVRHYPWLERSRYRSRRFPSVCRPFSVCRGRRQRNFFFTRPTPSPGRARPATAPANWSRYCRRSLIGQSASKGSSGVLGVGSGYV
jgi:hypothetical protein